MDELGAISPRPLAHFLNHEPLVKSGPHDANEGWSTSPKFSDLGDTLAYFLAQPIAALLRDLRMTDRLAEKTRRLGDSGLFLKGNYAHFERRTYPHKRYVRLGVDGYHPNAFSLFFEVAFGPSKQDGLIRDGSDAYLNSKFYPTQDTGVLCFVGFSAIKSSDNHGRWSMEKTVRHQDHVIEDFVASKTLVDELFDTMPGGFEHARYAKSANERIARVKIGFPSIDPNNDDWNTYSAIDCLKHITTRAMPIFLNISGRKNA